MDGRFVNLVSVFVGGNLKFIIGLQSTPATRARIVCRRVAAFGTEAYVWHVIK